MIGNMSISGVGRLLSSALNIRSQSPRLLSPPFRNKKGQLGKTITLLHVFVLVFIIIILFVSLTVSILPFKKVKAPAIVNVDLERSILLQSINVNGENMLVMEGLFRYPGKKVGLLEGPSFQIPFLNAMKKFFEEYSVKLPPEKITGYPDICLMMGIDDSLKMGRSLSFVRKTNGVIIQGDNQITLKVPVHRYVVYDFPDKKLDSFTIITYGKERIISYYYGACNGGRS